MLASSTAVRRVGSPLDARLRGTLSTNQNLRVRPTAHGVGGLMNQISGSIKPESRSPLGLASELKSTAQLSPS